MKKNSIYTLLFTLLLVINSPARADDNDLELIQYIEEAIEKINLIV